MNAATQPPDDERNSAGAACRYPAQPESAHPDVSGLDRGAQESYRDDPRRQHQPYRPDPSAAGTPGTTGRQRWEMKPRRIRVAGISTAPMGATEYHEAVDALAVLLSRHGHNDPPAEAA